MGTKGSSSQSSRLIVSIVGLLAIAAYALCAALQILVWNPLAAIPGATLDEIHEGLARHNESISLAAVLTWSSIGSVLGALVVLLTARRVISRMRTVVILQLLILVLGAPLYFSRHSLPEWPWRTRFSSPAAITLLGAGCCISSAGRH